MGSIAHAGRLRQPARVVMNVKGRIIETRAAKRFGRFEARFPFVGVPAKLVFRLIAAH